MMHFVLIGKYDPTTITESFAREREIMGNPPAGVEVIARYAMVGGKGGFIHIVEVDSAEQLAALLLEFAGLIEYEVIPIVELTEAKGVELVKEYVSDIPMHGPL